MELAAAIITCAVKLLTRVKYIHTAIIECKLSVRYTPLFLTETVHFYHWEIEFLAWSTLNDDIYANYRIWTRPAYAIINQYPITHIEIAIQLWNLKNQRPQTVSTEKNVQSRISMFEMLCRLFDRQHFFKHIYELFNSKIHQAFIEQKSYWNFCVSQHLRP